MAQDFKTAQPLAYYKEFLKKGVRPDGRGPMEYRKTFVNIDSLNTAVGSSLVRIGRTMACCGIKVELAEPALQTPNQGYFVVNVDLPALCSGDFQPGPPNEDSQITSQFLDDVVKSSKLINLEDLCIKERKLCWVVYADLVCLSHDGNLLDVMVTALYTALKNTNIPLMRITKKSGVPKASNETFHLNLSTGLSSTTLSVFDDSTLLLDPTREEEDLSSCSVTVVVGDDNKIFAVHKPGGCQITEEMLRECIQTSVNRNLEMSALVEGVVR